MAVASIAAVTLMVVGVLIWSATPRVDLTDNRPITFDLDPPVSTVATAASPSFPPLAQAADAAYRVEVDWPGLKADLGAVVKGLIGSTAWASEGPEVFQPISFASLDEIQPFVKSHRAGYSLSASPDRLVAGRGSTVVFTLMKNGRPVSGHDLDIHFQANPLFPNLRTNPRSLDGQGRITVRGLRPENPGRTKLLLVIDGDMYLEVPMEVEEKPKPAQAAAPQPAIAPMAAPAAAARAVPALEPEAVQVIEPEQWVIAPGLLRGQLENWSARAGYQLIWKSGHDFEMFSQAVFHDDFISSVKQLFHLMHTHGNLLKVTIYKGNKVLEVTEE